MLALSAFFLSVMSIDKNYAFAAAIPLFLSLFFLWVWRVLTFRYLSIAVDEQGVSTIFRGKPRTQVAWSDITNIETRKVLSVTSPAPRIAYTIVGGNAKIYFDDGLKDFQDLLARINERVKLPQ